MVDKTKFTVIVPTRERADTLYHCLQTLVRQRYENFEILVSDNFSRDNTEQVVRSICDSRIKYINTGRRVGMSRNYEFALSHVKDGWITYLGDDDGLVPDALALANNVIRETGCKALSSKWHHYTWPNFDGVVPPNRLSIRIGRGYRIRNAKAALRQSLKGRLDYLELPKVYIGGFAEYETLNRLRDESGYFFVSRTPDVYAAVALSLALDRYVYLHEPLSICGASAHSIGASHFKFSTNSSASAKYHAEEEIPFHPSLGDGRVRSVQLLLYEAFLQASHLHHNYAFTSTSEQLALSIAHSGNDQSVTEYCREIAKCQGIDFRLVEESARRISFGHRVRAICRVTPTFPGFQVDGGLLGLMNILDATIAANSLYFQMTSNKSWKVRKVTASLRKTWLYRGARKIYRTIWPGPGRIYELNQRYDRQLVEIMKRILKPDSTAIDVGAHRGSILQEMFALAPYGRHFAFEPIPHLATALTQDYPLARVYQMALSEQSGEATFHYLPNSPAESGLRLHRTHLPNSGNQEFVVDVGRLDDIIPATDQIALIKLDTEGAELPIIRGGLATIRRCRPIIVFETGRNTTPFYGVQPDDIFDTIVSDLNMNLSTMARWLKGKSPYTKARFRYVYEKTNEFYFMAY